MYRVQAELQERDLVIEIKIFIQCDHISGDGEMNPAVVDADACAQCSNKSGSSKFENADFTINDLWIGFSVYAKPIVFIAWQWDFKS